MNTVPVPVASTGAAPQGQANSASKGRLLAICNIDGMAWVLLRPWLTGLKDDGYEVHLACAPGPWFPQLAAAGFHLHPVSIQRTFWPWAHLRPLFQLLKLMRGIRFDVVNTHSAVAAAPGRIAAWLTGCPTIVYTVHGFYFHNGMPVIPRYLFEAVEWLLGRITGYFMFVSEEDRQTALRAGITKTSTSMTIFNGVNLGTFSPGYEAADETRAFRRELGIDDSLPVVGYVGRIVREKGLREFLEMARYVSSRTKALFLIVGDSLPSDRDQFAPVLKEEVAKAGLTSSFLFTGHTDRVSDYLRIMDMFVLPSYREGFPRSIVEAMSSGLPVVTTDIRGCREAVVHGETGLIVPARDGQALGKAVERLLANPREAAAMGRAGRRRAVELYDERTVQRRFVDFIDLAVHRTKTLRQTSRP